MKDFSVVWTLFAQEELDFIFQYYSLKSEIVALKIVENILNSIERLQTFPLSGQEEEMLKYLKKGYRYVVEGKYKIIYRVSGSIVYIIDVFDTRQNPKKILRKRK